MMVVTSWTWRCEMCITTPLVMGTGMQISAKMAAVLQESPVDELHGVLETEHKKLADNSASHLCIHMKKIPNY